MRIKQAVILAGGLGERLKPLTDTIPKPMIVLNNKPFLEYLIDLLKENGIEEIVLLLGYMPKKIIDYFGDGSKFGIRIKYSIGNVSFETGKRIKYAENLLDDNFLLMYCDNYFPLNLEKLINSHVSLNVPATMTVYSNKDNFTKNNVFVNKEGLVLNYDKNRANPTLNGVDIGFFIFNKKIIDNMPTTNFPLYDLFKELIESKNFAAFLTNHRYYSIGSIDRLSITEDYLKEKNVIFLDRDGVINEKAPKADYVKNWKEFNFIPGAKEAIALLSRKGYDIYIVSNQAGIARKMFTEIDLADIHKNMLEEIEKCGGKVKGIYFCPHGWDEGCECRKPRPGMFFQAAREHNINLTKTMFIGDDERDVEAGNAADIKTMMINSKEDLLSIAKFIINERNKIR